MSKQETFRRLLAGEYDDARHVTIGSDLDLLEQMRIYGWFAYSRPLIKRRDHYRGDRHCLKEGSLEWKADIMRALNALQII